MVTISETKLSIHSTNVLLDVFETRVML